MELYSPYSSPRLPSTCAPIPNTPFPEGNRETGKRGKGRWEMVGGRRERELNLGRGKPCPYKTINIHDHTRLLVCSPFVVHSRVPLSHPARPGPVFI